MHRYHANFLHRDKWWIAWADEVPGALTQGQTLDEARENLKDAIALMKEPVDTDSLPAPSTEIVREIVQL